MRPLADAEAQVVADMRDGTQVNTILNESVEIVHHEPDVAVPSSPFEKVTPGPAQTAAQTQVQPATVAQPAKPAATAATAAAPAQPAAGAAPAEPVKRKRRTREEMEAAAAALKASREGQPVATPAVAVPLAAQNVAPAAEVNQADQAAPGEFDNLLENLLPK
jgi:hypothetical protein